MTSIRDLLQEDLIIGELAATDRDGVLAEFAALLKRAGRVRDDQALTELLREREALGSTGIGDGIAIPHAKLPLLEGAVVAFGRSRNGVDFHAVDGKPARLFFLLVTPDADPGAHLRALARISRIMKNRELRERLQLAAGPAEMRRMIADEDSRYPQR